ncbi:ABC transporter ATP-binding protein [Corynebacterium sp. sy039]|uniref:ABC transporter ATP-binding protein n=1 Tax=Corynebacterium sp. sy039 TaxID=2599641 RepID=UPI0011B5ED71|nr:ABC transporter ATP-binding protein [Corynebacterium sp. sy039]QDZ41812.1 ABC transporter ATP-binding protein [Corynebacterium sp. sy039]
MSELLVLDRISHTYKTKTESVQAIRDVSLSVASGEKVALMGPSGSGKSTLLMIAGLMAVPSSGEVVIGGAPAPVSEKDRAKLRNEFFGFAHQEYAVVEYLSAWENVAIPLEYATPKVSRRQRRERAVAELGRYGLEHCAKRRVSELSGGQRQRVGLARATVTRPTLLIADEPTAALDVGTRDSILDLFETVMADAGGALIATHDPVVAERCDRVIQLG